MIIRFMIIFMFVTNCYAIVSSYQREVDYDKMLRESSKIKRYTPTEIENMQKLRRERRNAGIEYKMQQLTRPQSVSKLIDKKDWSSNRKMEKSINKRGREPTVAIIVLIVGAFMLLYSYLSMLRKKKT